MKRKLNKSMRLTLIYRTEGLRPFELLKDNHKYGRKYSIRGALSLLEQYSNRITLTPEAQKALSNLEQITTNK